MVQGNCIKFLQGQVFNNEKEINLNAIDNTDW